MICEGDRQSRGHEFESRHQILRRTNFTFICCNFFVGVGFERERT